MLDALNRPFGWQEHNACAINRITAKQLGETQVIADCERNIAPGCMEQWRIFTRAEVLIFVHQAKAMDLAIVAEQRTIPIVECGRVEGSLGGSVPFEQ